MVDLAADGTLPQAKIRAKLHEIHKDRERIAIDLANTSEQLAVGAAVLRDALRLARDPQRLYRNSQNNARRLLNQTFYERFYIDDLTVADDEKAPL